jgi:hypothetical protein
MVSHTGVSPVQSESTLQGCLVHVPTEPSLLLQYSSVGQLSIPPEPTTRQPATQRPVVTVEVSHKLPVVQSVSATHPQVTCAVTQTGVAGDPTHALAFKDEQSAH